MLEWINRGPLPFFVEDAPNVFPLRRDGEDAALIGVANLCADPMPQLALQLASPFAGKPVVEYLTPKEIASESMSRRSMWAVTCAYGFR